MRKPKKPTIIDDRCSHDPSCKRRGYYDVNVYCMACSFKGILRRTKGHHSYSLHYLECPECECHELELGK